MTSGRRGGHAALEDYEARRDFGRTPEPRGGEGPAGAEHWSYVVQKHDARRLHFDLRLELDGVLKSWAVTRGPSLDPAERRLAVRTEDHPIEYGDFEGIIPEGEYGGGTVMLWDRGHWTPKSDPHEGLRRGSLKFELKGRRLKGGFALVRLRERDSGRRRRGATKRENWLLIKERDAHADPALDPVARWQRSVATRRGMDSIARAADRVHRPAGIPRFIAPQLATLEKEAPDGDAWLHEIKFDGYRVLVAIGGGKARVHTRSGLDWSGRFGDIVRACAALPIEDAIIDGEVVVLDDRGISRFSLLQKAMKGGAAEFTLMTFDLLRLDGEDLRRLPLLERKAGLAGILEGAAGNLVYCDHQIGHGPAVRDEACRLGLEGIVSKRVDARYRSGRGRSWIKVKCGGRGEFVIGGYRPSSVRGRPFSSLLVGEFVDGRLEYRGRVGTGFGGAALAALAGRMRALERKTPPFASVPRAIARDARWLTPRLVAELAYAERTADGLLRHPSYLGLREDKRAEEVTASPEE